jgi:Trp operon repressor
MVMAGVTLTADEIKAAPPEVRRWLEQEIVRAFGVQSAPAPACP